MQSIERMPKTEQETVAQLLANFPRLLEGLNIVKIEKQYRVSESYRVDLLIEVRLGKLRRKLIVEVKTLGEPRLALQAIAQLREAVKHVKSSYPVFAARYVTEATRRLCKAENVGYVDLLGNVYLRFETVLVDRVAQASAKLERRGVKQLLAPKATRVLRALLVAPEEPARISDLAQRCSMSPAGVYWVVRLLEAKGYVERDAARKVVVVKPKELLDTWASAWTMQKNTWTSYFSFEKTPETLIKKVAELGARKNLRYAFTLMAGASLVAPFVRYEDVWLYVAGDEAPWAKGLDLKPVDGGGNLFLVKPYDEGVFMDLQDFEGVKVVSNIQLYVDLYNYAARGREQAEFLRDRKLRYLESPQ